jgi:SAM-dependent methyltransferase
MTRPYDPRDYWSQRLAGRFNLRGVGHLGFSEAYNAWMYRRKGECLEAVVTEPQLRGARVLDVGCGTGFFVRWYDGRGAAVHGIDITDVSVERLRGDFPRHRFDVADIGSRDFAQAGTCDIVNIWDVLYHIVDDRRFATALENLASAVAPGGRLILTDQLAGAADVQVASHVKFRCLATYQARLPALGLQLQRLHPLYFKLNDDRTGRAQSDELAPEYYEYDTATGFLAADNLAIGVWRRE